METKTRVDPDTVPVTFLRSTQDALRELPVLKQASALAIDTETVILRDADGKPLKRDLDLIVDGDGAGPWRVMSIAARMPLGNFVAWVLDMGYIDAHAIAHLFDGLRPFGWNAPFDRNILLRGGIAVHDWWDGMIADANLRCGSGGGDSRKYTSLAKASKVYLDYDIDGKKSTRLDYQTVEVRPELTAEEIQYAAIDAVCTLLCGGKLMSLLADVDLTNTFIRDANGQPFVWGMRQAGLPMDDAYSAIVEAERTAAAVAAERVAMATTGKEMLATLRAWALHAGVVTDAEFGQDPVQADQVALSLLHDPETFGRFLADVSAQVNSARDRMGAALGVTQSADLFTEADDATFLPLPFDPDNETELRKWLSKQLPHFAACYAVASREDDVTLTDLLTLDEDTIKARAGRRRTLVKEHDLEAVLGLVVDGTAGADLNTVAVAVELLAYRRYSRILAQYGELLATGAEAYLQPTWDLNSQPQVQAMFNEHAADLVADYFGRTAGTARLFEAADSVDGDAMKMIGGELADALLEWRKRSKIVSTYGDEMLNLINPVTGRVHAKYDMSLTGTGRLNSYKPNAQNLSPLVKPYIRPAKVNGKVRRVLVCADLSQAELRFVADAAQDVEMLAAFRSGEDLHTRTASLMFSVDLVTVKKHGHLSLKELVGKVDGIEKYAAETPDLVASLFYKTQRQKAKRVAFGYAYGLKGASLARGLTVEGVPTTKEEADELLAKFDQAYPQVAAWMAGRVNFIAKLADNMRNMHAPSGVDFASTWLLHSTHAKAHSAYAALTKTLGRTPTDVELAERLKPQLIVDRQALDKALAENDGSVENIEAKLAAIDAETERVAKLARWALSYDHAVALTPDGTPWQFESRTAGGRRRLFQVVTSQLMLAVVSAVARSRKPGLNSYADAWAVSWNERKLAEHEAKKVAGKARGVFKPISLAGKNGRVIDGRDLEDLFKGDAGKEMRNDFVGFCLARMQAGQMEQVWRMAMADRIRAMGNQYRNHPIQGGVADAVMLAFGDIARELREKFPTAFGIQSVHDSIVVECDVEDALAVRDLVVSRMQEALASFCPTVPCVADGDVQLSLDDKTILTEEQVNELVADLVLAA